ncbi:SNF2-related protein [Parabacteroides sp. AGMB00274]|uniref:SNF2-related protein n=1 Tax=Parabacteroides faecalis TaxID=2924040 RepID=A0ABT0BZ29_9BACT|nr:SNF2-related protein [Parabacteroides faecalis]MCJ2379989.1 SNF2-related protein [Parabacteroides faecalis]
MYKLEDISMNYNITDYQAKYIANLLTRRLPANDLNKLTASLQDAQVDLTPHQVEAALFAFKSPLSNGAILADEVGLGKTIEAGIILSQHWSEHKRRLLVICPANLRKQWSSELLDKFYLPSVIMESKSFSLAVEEGCFNPFDTENIVICSLQFAKTKAAYIKRTNWDLVIIDEAHRLRNVYKPQNKTANAIKAAIASKKKILMTATPLQNSILELYGLVSIIDDYVFGDLKSFKSQFGHNLTEAEFHELRRRLQPVCKRTLRRQVLEYIKYTKRIAIVEEFYPTENEQRLYDMVTEYLSKPQLYALPNSQRQLMTLILRKLLASSTYAIYGTFCSLINRLQEILAQADSLYSLENEVIAEYEEDNDQWVDREETEIEETEELHPDDIEGIKKEIEELKQFRDLAEKIKKNSKAEHLFVALDKGFEQLKNLGAAQKALIFTESKRTQEFLYELLEKRGFKGKVVRFNGTNADKESTAIYNDWLTVHKGTSKVTGSPTADRRAALVDYFRNEATIMIATEAAAEGINLQFCSLIVNYDMPWNPQRIEQRIGRCHRYGQKFDVVVINFLNKGNAADKRVYQLLDEKFQLFNGVFGASDEVLGSIGNGVDFEKRIAQIYNECRTTEEIEKAFDTLQAELQEQISEKMIKARSALLENFDESVKEKLRDNLAQSKKNLSLFEKNLWLLVQHAFKDKAVFNQTDYSFEIESGQYAGEKFTLAKDAVNVENLQPFRMGHPLAKEIITACKSYEIESGLVEFHYTETEGKMKLLDELIGSEGYMQVEKITIDSFEQEDHLVIACLKQDGSLVYPDIAERMLSLPAEKLGTEVIENNIQEVLHEKISEMQNEIVADSAERNSKFFDEEMDKLDNWADDMKLGLEKEISDLDQEIRLRKSEAKKIIRLDEKVSAQRAIKELEKKRIEKRQYLYEAQDEIDEKKDMLLDKIEKMLKQKVSWENLFTIKWKLK